MTERGLYIHIPFCASKCAYCDFYSLPEGNTSEIKEKYIEALCKSFEMLSEGFADTLFTSVYIGGGTPSILSEGLLETLLSSLQKNFNISREGEFTCEANPATLTKEKLSVLKNHGVNRLSLGCQSTNEDELKILSRIHSFEDFKESFFLAREAGFENISADLMYGIPLQTLSSLEKSIRDIAELSPEHISLYGLRVEPNTPFGRKKDLILPDDDSQCEMYISACKLLASLGYKRYEISNFARGEKYSRHNMRYWECGEYLGIGAAAHSFVNSLRYSYPRDISVYINAVNSEKMPEYAECTPLSESDRRQEYIMLSLRLERGLNTEKFEELFGKKALKELLTLTKHYIPKFMVRENGHLRFTTDGFLVSNTILSSLI